MDSVAVMVIVLVSLALPTGSQSASLLNPTAETQDATWQAKVSRGLRRAEYNYHPVTDEAGVWSAPNRSQELRSRVSRDGLEVFSRGTSMDGAGAPWRLRLRTTSFGRVADVSALSFVAIKAEDQLVELYHDRLTEWFENSERGIEQGWTIAAPPGGVEPLWIGLELGGGLSLCIDEGARSGVFVDGCGEAQLRYRDLIVVDAQGRELDARLVPTPAGVGILIDDGWAAYPLTVDPVLTGPAWTVEGDQTSALFGYSLATAGDVNGDGYSDVIIGAHAFDNGETDEGRAYIFLGSATGLSTTPAWTAESDQAGGFFGVSVATAGDVNGDGYSDVIIGAHTFDNGETDEGRAYIFLGSATDLSTTPAWTAESDQAGGFFGVSVATAGDVNGDGFSDVIVGAVYFDNGETDEGRAFVYLGSATGLSTSPAWTAESDQADTLFGFGVSAAGDVNGDGFSDVIVGAFDFDNGETNEGRAYVYLGSATGLSTSPAWTAESDQASALFGSAVSTAGDVNGDGFSDVIVGAPYCDNGETEEGRAYVYLGSAMGLSASPAWTAESNQVYALFGTSVATAGDVNGDSYSDVIVGAFLFDNGDADEGRVSIYLGSAAGLSASPAWTAESDQPGAFFFGISASTGGDVNGDGYSDVIVGAPYYGEPDEGRAYAYLGSATGLSVDPQWSADSDQADASLGISVSTAGDVNGDGYGDTIVGAYLLDNGQMNEGGAYVYLGSDSGLATSAAWIAESNQASAFFGVSVSTAGDVNGDGFSDVIVGASNYDLGLADYGRAFVYMGSSSGLSASAAWTVDGLRAGSLLGTSVASAGDVNGDGYGDVIVGASHYTSPRVNEGGAFLYLGSGAGLSGDASWTAEGGQFNANFGQSVATAGDVNGDGYDDVIVGAPRFSNVQFEEGRAFLYLGSRTGLSVAAAWTAESDQPSARLGNSVSTAGDVNSDGYSDVIVGAFCFHNGETEEGRVNVFLGSGAGLSPNPVWTAESNQGGAYFGSSVATAGDVNGDGYSDVIVGAAGFDNAQTDVGRAYVYLGSSSGLSPSPAWTAESDQASAQFGFSVATAGDVNGDGYSDVIVGAYGFDNGETDEGSAYVFMSQGGWLRSLQQRKRSNLAPLAPLADTGLNGLFRIRGDFPKNLVAFSWASPSTPLAHLEWEIELLGVPFDGVGIQSGVVNEALVPAGGTVTFSELAVAGLAPPKLRNARDVSYHWRARIATNNPLFPHTAWFTQPGFVLRVAGR